MYQAKKGIRMRMRNLSVVALAIVSVVALGGSCFLNTNTTLCETTGLRCKQGQECAAKQGVCIDIGGCGNGVVSGEEICDDGNILSGDECSADCESLEICGNFIIDEVKGETCDDGNFIANDDCDPNCHVEFCGNGMLDPGEFCDDDNAESLDGCSGDCLSNEVCGNDIIDEHLSRPEECDPGPIFPNPIPNTATCDSDCTEPKCGDGHLNIEYPMDAEDHREQCDPNKLDGTGKAENSQNCDKDCTFVVCGDSLENEAAGETCDIGMGGIDTPMCDGDCTDVICGDNHTNPTNGELCDPGGVSAPLNIRTCDSDCTLPSCGDGHVNPAFMPDGSLPEQCDPVDRVRSDDLPDVCRTNCRNPYCGDGVKDSGESCDPGGNGKQAVGCAAGVICIAFGTNKCTCTI